MTEGLRFCSQAWCDEATALQAPLDVWRRCAEGEDEISRLLITRKVKLRDTRQKSVACNYRAVDALVRAWAQVPTDWDV